MIKWCNFVVTEGLTGSIDVPMADVFQRILNDVSGRLRWRESEVECDIVITSADEVTFQNNGRWRRPELSVPATYFPSLSDKRKHLHLFSLAVVLIDAVADGLEIEKVVYKRVDS